MKKLTALATLSTLLASSCARENTSPQDVISTRCHDAMAQIALQDGFTQILCGCAESAAGPIEPPASLTCTIPAGTTVFVHFIATRANHQLVPVGSPTFAASTESRKSRVHAVTLSTTGTYRFQDALNTAVTGQFIVQ